MIKTEFICDKCKQSQSSNDQFWEVIIGYFCLGLSQYSYGQKYNDSHVKAQWCRACMEKSGLLGGKDSPEEQKPPVTPPTLEDIIRDIVREEVQVRS